MNSQASHASSLTGHLDLPLPNPSRYPAHTLNILPILIQMLPRSVYEKPFRLFYPALKIAKFSIKQCAGVPILPMLLFLYVNIQGGRISSWQQGIAGTLIYEVMELIIVIRSSYFRISENISLSLSRGHYQKN